MYLLKPWAGWCHIDIGKFHGSASYLTDVPMQFLDSFELYFSNWATPAINFDEEGSNFIIIVEEYRTYIISERAGTKLYKIEVDREDFIKSIVGDIEDNFEEFVKWDAFTPEIEEEEEAARRRVLKSKIEAVKLKLDRYI